MSAKRPDDTDLLARSRLSGIYHAKQTTKGRHDAIPDSPFAPFRSMPALLSPRLVKCRRTAEYVVSVRAIPLAPLRGRSRHANKAKDYASRLGVRTTGSTVDNGKYQPSFTPVIITSEVVATVVMHPNPVSLNRGRATGPTETRLHRVYTAHAVDYSLHATSDVNTRKGFSVPRNGKVNHAIKDGSKPATDSDTFFKD